MIHVGYACETVGVYGHHILRMHQATFSKARLYEIIEHNLSILEAMIDYNHRNGIFLFRLSSDLIPFATSDINPFPWEHDFIDKFRAIGEKLRRFAIRFSFHPGPFTVINSPSERVFTATTKELAYHYQWIKLLGGDTSNKIVIHLGGVYSDKEKSKTRFIEQFLRLPEAVRQHIVIENDETHYDIFDVLEVATTLQVPVVFDYFHHQLLSRQTTLSLQEILNLCEATWKKEDGSMKVHYSEPYEGKPYGTHSLTIHTTSFLDVWEKYNHLDIDVMLEVKDKNLSAIKCQQVLLDNVSIVDLESAWSHYKYLILEHSASMYQKIRELLKNKENPDTKAFYAMIEEALDQAVTIGSVINAYQHVCGYFKNIANDRELADLHQWEEALKKDIFTRDKIKAKVLKLAVKYHQTYLIDSYYFYLNGFQKVNY